MTAFGEVSFCRNVLLASASHVRASEACKVSKCALVVAVNNFRAPNDVNVSLQPLLLPAHRQAYIHENKWFQGESDVSDIETNPYSNKTE
eukprot:2996849-Amphidinium_carterae.2